jgi:hypothetical protein
MAAELWLLKTLHRSQQRDSTDNSAQQHTQAVPPLRTEKMTQYCPPTTTPSRQRIAPVTTTQQLCKP